MNQETPLQHGSDWVWTNHAEQDKKKEKTEQEMDAKREEVHARLIAAIKKAREEEERAKDEEWAKHLATFGKLTKFAFDLAGNLLVFRGARHMAPGWKQSAVLALGLGCSHMAGWVDGVTNPRWSDLNRKG